MICNRTCQGLYQLLIAIDKPEALAVVSLKTWHERFCHVNIDYLKQMQVDNVTKGMDVTGYEDFVCETCIRGNQARRISKLPRSKRPCSPGQFLHADLCGPFPLSFGKSKYLLLIKDEMSGYRISLFLKQKHEVANYLKQIFVKVFTETKTKVLRIRTDNGGEFKTDFDNTCRENGEIHEFSSPYCPN